MNRIILLNILLVLGLGAIALGQTTAPASDAEAANLRAVADEQVRTIHDLQAELAKLRGHLAGAAYGGGRFAGPNGLAQKIDFVADDEPFNAVLERLAKLTNLNVVADWNTIERQNTKRNTPISVNLKGVTLEKLLDAIGAYEHLEYDFDDTRTLLISKGELFLQRNLITRFYDIRQVIAGAQGESRDDKVARIKNDIESSIDPTSWDDQGGRAGTLFEFNGQLVVTANRHDQMTVAAYLKKQAEHQ